MKTISMLLLLHGFMLLMLVTTLGTKSNVKHVKEATALTIKAIMP